MKRRSIIKWPDCCGAAEREEGREPAEGGDVGERGDAAGAWHAASEACHTLRGTNAARASQVPGFVKEGDIVIVRPSTGEFVKRKL